MNLGNYLKDEVRTALAGAGDLNGDEFPGEGVRRLQEQGVLAGPLPRALGGLGWDMAMTASVAAEIARVSPQLALIASMPMGFAAVYAQEAGRTEGQARAWAGQQLWVADKYRIGQLFAACNSERGAGGAITAIRTVAHEDRDGHVLLTGEKTLATGSGHADWFFSTARRLDPSEPVELYVVDVHGPGVAVHGDWDGFGMRGTESHSVSYRDARTAMMVGFPGFLSQAKPFASWFTLYSAVSAGCARGMLDLVRAEGGASPAIRSELARHEMIVEAIESSAIELARAFTLYGEDRYQHRVVRTKTHNAQQAVQVCAALFALAGGRHYRRQDPLARRLADVFAFASVRPPLALGLEMLHDAEAPADKPEEAAA